MVFNFGVINGEKLKLAFYFSAYSCSMELCLDSGSVRKLRYIEYFMHRVNLLRFYEITPVVVFDGGNVPCKAATEEERNRYLFFLFFFFLKS